MADESSAQSFRDLVISSLAELNTNQKNAVERLGSMNESIKELYLRTEANKTSIMTHASTCPVRDLLKDLTVQVNTAEASHPTAAEVDKRVSELEQTINKQYTELKTLLVQKTAEDSGKDKIISKWWPLVIIALTAVLSALGTLILAHADILSK